MPFVVPTQPVEKNEIQAGIDRRIGNWETEGD